MKKFILRHKSFILFVLTLVGLYGILFALHITCPIKFLTGISCPGCGMTRATLSALRFDFERAFYYHPLWFLLVPVAASLILCKAKGWRFAFKLIVSLSVILMVAAYIVRLAVGSDIVVFSPEESVFYKIFLKIRELILK